MEKYSVVIDDSKTIFYLKDSSQFILHRKNGPAVIRQNGTQEWWLHGNLHREDGPAILKSTGDNLWYLNGVRHRTNGPAITLYNHQEWWVSGILHREDGPAIKYADGRECYCINGTQLTFNKYNKYKLSSLIHNMYNLKLEFNKIWMELNETRN